MVATVEEVVMLVPELGPDRVGALLTGLGPKYAERFSAAQIALHLKSLEGLSTEGPLVALVDEGGEGGFVCTVIAFDYPAEFAYIAGVLASMGFDVSEGEAFTLAPPPGGGGESAPRPARPASPARAKIIDSFEGKVREEMRSEGWAEELAERLGAIARLLERGGADSQYRTRRAVAELAASALELASPSFRSVLYPVLIEVATPRPGLVRMRVESQDTPFFLFVFGVALSIQGLAIERVSIRTRGSRIEDEFDFGDAVRARMDDPARLDELKLSVLLAKQFTSFLGGAGDPGAAMLRFADLLGEALAAPDRGNLLARLSDWKVMEDLARLLGASDFLWEDFVRLQYEALLPMLGDSPAGTSFSEPQASLPRRLDAVLEGAAGEEDFVAALNGFKDREILHYDLDHILRLGGDFRALGGRLTALAELVVDRAASFAYRSLSARFGEPRAAAGLAAKYAVLGLGKLGGCALGYASDIELLFAYDDSGRTDGPESVDNGEFFGELVRSVQSYIKARREGIFRVDLRLRPYGASGPLACSLESFCTYYAPGGPAHSYERLALIRLRAIGGDRALGERVERIRDDLVYDEKAFDAAEFRALRERQLREKSKPGRRNAKFSSGALVDVEYAIQILQLELGASDARLRTPRIDEAIEALAATGALAATEARAIEASYGFFRLLINGLRMLRGSALDLFLPEEGSEEYEHLARRIGYSAEGGLGAAKSLSLDFEARTAEVRAFAEHRFGGESRYAVRPANVADLVLGEAREDERDSILSAKGFKHPPRALVNLRGIAGLGAEPEEPEPSRLAGFARLAIVACDILSRRPDPDMALNNWERFVSSLPDPAGHLAEMLAQPRRLEVLLDIFSASQFLADILVRDPELLDYITDPSVMRASRPDPDLRRELAETSASAAGYAEWLGALRRFRRKETLRIGARDLCLRARTETIMEELSSLADCVIGSALGRIRGEVPAGEGFCVLALGKLGGKELNYSSDVDLLCVWESAGGFPADEGDAVSLTERLRAALSDHTAEGYAYRIDLRLRPYGSAGQLAFELGALLRYYAEEASDWELQALIKARPVAGDIGLGSRFIEAARALIAAPRDPRRVADSIGRLRRQALRALSRGIAGGRDVKTGLGGIREVEFIAQGLQLVWGSRNPELIKQNTLEALSALSAAGALPAGLADRLSDGYLFLRRVEHFLQIYEDRQTHRLPTDPDQLEALSRRMLGYKATTEGFMAELERRFGEIHSAYTSLIEEGLAAGEA
jgi:glutamate-ammonia-ligase adenylyltransferase